MLKKILIVLGLLIAALVLIVALQPADFRIVRTATIPGPPAKVFPQVNDFHNWEKWSPWAKLDPEIKETYEGAPGGNGAIYSWSGNNQVGVGRMTITESRTNELVRIKLDFIKPFASTASTEFTFKPVSNQTEVTWSMSGKNNFLAKGFGLLMNMDKMVGGQFDKGLAQMKSVVETAPE
jgi:hypothetical protein